MKKLFRIILINIGIFLFINSFNVLSAQSNTDFTVLIHGGAGTITRKNMSPEKEKKYRKILDQALQTGYTILAAEGTALDAVEAVIKVMEDSPLFNAGKGAVFTNAGTNELDASIMDGSTLLAGAVSGVKTVKNPISAARKVMEETWHVMLSGAGADQFALKQGLEIVSPDYFFTKKRWDYLQKLKKDNEEKLGTVGCVALDKHGNLAAGTSTGGITNKLWGRIGDSPIIGAGTYASNLTCAVSCTGQGEYFIRGALAYDVSALMDYKKYSVEKAAQSVINKLSERGGQGGLIALDSNGSISMTFNTEGMYRGYIKRDGKSIINIYGKD